MPIPAGLTQMGKDFGASMTGNTEAARLIIYDYRKAMTDAMTRAQQNADRRMGKIQGLEGAEKTRAEGVIAKTQLNSVSNAEKGIHDQLADAQATGVGMPGSAKTFYVHFNPTKLDIYATSLPAKKPDAGGKETVQSSSEKANMNLTVTLLFDEMNVYDSFMADKFTMGLTASGVKNVVAAVKSAKGTKVWSVQDEVEGLIAALRNPYTRNVSFRWANFCFSGQLSNVSAQYTMFSTHGRPVRAQVLLRIKHEMDDRYLNSWYQNYATFFAAGAKSLVSASQKNQNVLNFNV